MVERVSHKWTHMTAVAIAMIIAIALSYSIWLGATYETAIQTLRLNARHRIDSSDRFPTEGRALLSVLNASVDAPCSDADVATFRRLLMNASYVKELGRMRGSRLMCSAGLRQSELPETSFEPSFREPDGLLVYTKMEALNMANVTPIVLRLGDSYVALDPSDREEIPDDMRFGLTMRDVPTGANHLGGNFSKMTGDALVKDGYGRSGGYLYATACSLHYPPCMTAAIPIERIMLRGHRHLMASIIAGCAIGGWLGFVWVAFLRLRRGLEHQLRRAIKTNALRVVYQPLVDISTKTVIGAEALVRWTDQDNVAISPDVFIKIAEHRGFVNEITELVVRRALADFAQYMRANPGFRVNVNVAASDLTDPQFPVMLEGHLRSTKIPAHNLGIEITEGATARHEEAIKSIVQLRRLGHKVYIDDFGTGYSSLAYLKDLGVDGIKVDRAFTRAIGTDSVTVGILPQILAMAQVLGLRVVAEGIETQEQASYYRGSVEPVTGQGWLFGFPIPASEFHALWLGRVAVGQTFSLFAQTVL